MLSAVIFIVAIMQNTQIDCVGKMQNLLILQWEVCKSVLFF